MPPCTNEKLRLYLDVKADYITDQREDLPLDKYGDFHLFAAPVLEYEVHKNKFVNLAVGYDYVHVDAQKVVPTNVFAIPKNTEGALITRIGFDFLFGTPLLISDLNHTLKFYYAFLYRGSHNNLSEIYLKYRKVFFSKWVEYHIKYSGIAIYNDIQFFDEFYLRELDFHSSFDRKYFIRRGSSISLEARVNVHGNKVQLGLFDDVAIFQHFLESSNTTEVVYANSVGVGGYFLFYDAIQAYITYAFGYNSNKETSHDVSFGVKKLF